MRCSVLGQPASIAPLSYTGYLGKQDLCASVSCNGARTIPARRIAHRLVPVLSASRVAKICSACGSWYRNGPLVLELKQSQSCQSMCIGWARSKVVSVYPLNKTAGHRETSAYSICLICDIEQILGFTVPEVVHNQKCISALFTFPHSRLPLRAQLPNARNSFTSRGRSVGGVQQDVTVLNRRDLSKSW